MMRQLAYQDEALATVEAWLAALGPAEAGAAKVEALLRADPDLMISPPDAPAKAWQMLAQAGRLPPSRAGKPFSPRVDGIGRAVPNATLKVPTGGGKTFLAVSAVAAVQTRLLQRSTGMVLWIVPNEAIYRQTKRQLANRQHPYRQVLDRVANGRVRIMEKTDTLRREDTEGSLCIMLLMLASAARLSTEVLKLFQDRGDVHGFTPSEGDMAAHRDLLDAVPNLDSYGGAGDLWPCAKDSMGNALRLLRPVVVLDEGHRATSEIAHKTLYGFNPRLVLELTATPHDVERRNQPARYANLLVDIPGTALHAEGMIKLPIVLDTRPDAGDWRGALAAAKERLDSLQEAANQLRSDTGRYIRPILLVQVERVTGDSHDTGLVHAQDVRSWLLTTGLDAAEVAEKTSKQDDLAAPENQDLLSPTNRVRVILTKSALQEGWDCPFAYVLCSLANVTSTGAVTQLVGRILRQPGAQPTGVEALDQCYVITRHPGPGIVIEALRRGLQEDGLGDLVHEVQIPDGSKRPPAKRRIERRAGLETPVSLPQVVWADAGEVRPLDYDMDIRAGLDWRDLDVSALVKELPDTAQGLRGSTTEVRLVGGPEVLQAVPGVSLAGLGLLDPVHIVRMLSDLVPNPFVAWDVVAKLTAGLHARGLGDVWQGERAGLILDRLRAFLYDEQDRKAEAFFLAAIQAGQVQFQLRQDELDWPMPNHILTTQPPAARQLLGADGQALTRSMFTPVYEDEFSSQPERAVAVYMDAEEPLRWWHRNVALTGYGLQGWRRHRVYPDFVVSCKRADGDRLVTIETKGDQLAGNADTMYKSALFELLTSMFSKGAALEPGKLVVTAAHGATMECHLVPVGEWTTKLPPLLVPQPVVA